VHLVENDKLDVANEIGAAVHCAAAVRTKAVRRALRHSRMLRRISVVMIRHGASGLICTSPVRMPTFCAPNVCLKSRNFWLDSALMGDV
jgi:hypothetical protein